MHQLDAGQSAVRVDRIVHTGEGRDVAVVPQAALNDRSDVAGRMDVCLFCTNNSPAAFRLHSAHGRHGTRIDAAHAVAMGHLEEAVLGGQRADFQRLKKDVVAWVPGHRRSLLDGTGSDYHWWP